MVRVIFLMLMVMDMILLVYQGGDDCDDTDPIRWDECGMSSLETVDTDCFECPGPNAIDVDSNGQPHIAYEDFGDVWYRFRDTQGNLVEL